MNSFSSVRIINNEQYQFCFSKIARIDCAKYYVAVKQDDQLVTAFEMKRDSYHKTWIVCQPAPEWIMAEGAVLAQLIESSTTKSVCPDIQEYNLQIIAK